MGGKHSRGKGQRGEREVVRWFAPLLPDGWQVRRALPYEQGHDLRFLAPDGTRAPGCWAIECKRYADWSVVQELQSRHPSQRWQSWWEQTQRQAEAAGRAPMLCTRGDRQPWWVWTRYGLGAARPRVLVLLPDGQGVCGTLLEHCAESVRQHLLGGHCEWSDRAGAEAAGTGAPDSRGQALG